jgi:Uncharacterized conserved protein
VVIDYYISFLGDMDPKSSVLWEEGFEGVDLRGKILVFRGARGSSCGWLVSIAML